MSDLSENDGPVDGRTELFKKLLTKCKEEETQARERSRQRSLERMYERQMEQYGFLTDDVDPLMGKPVDQQFVEDINDWLQRSIFVCVQAGKDSDEHGPPLVNVFFRNPVCDLSAELKPN